MIKKSTTKPKTSPAPATKAGKPPAKNKTAAATPAAARAVVKPVATKTVKTTIVAKIDVGFGNALYLRGSGPGLSWDKGVLMTCVAGDEWRVELGESARSFVAKFLVNDLTWSSGPDYTFASGERSTVTPEF